MVAQLKQDACHDLIGAMSMQKFENNGPSQAWGHCDGGINK
jgi:hypothetical protein